MENQVNDLLMKSRSASACIKAGYQLFLGNFKILFKSSWHVALLYSLVFGLLTYVGIIHLPKLYLNMLAGIRQAHFDFSSFAELLAWMPIPLIVGGAFELLFYSRGLSMLYSHSRQGTVDKTVRLLHFNWHIMRKLTVAVLLNLAIQLVPLMLFALSIYYFRSSFYEASSPTLTYQIFSTLYFIAIALLSLPLSYISMKYLMSDKAGFWKTLATEYNTGLRHFGFMFTVMIVSVLVITVAEYIIIQPAIVLFIANIQANYGMLLGDPLGMPDYITTLSLVVFCITGFIQPFIRMSVFFTSYYMYGSIEKQEQERKDTQGD